MKKKIITLALACVLTLGMSVTAFAAPSVTVGTDAGTSTGTSAGTGSSSVVRETATATDANGNPVRITSFRYASDSAVAVEATQQATALYGVAPLSIVDFDVAGASEENPVTIKWARTDINAGDTIKILHKVNGSWIEESNLSVVDGAVYVTVTSCSPFAMVRTAAANANLPYSPEYYENLKAMHGTSNAAATTAAGSSVASPKTADNGVLGFAAVAALCGAAFVLVPRKKMA